VFADGLDASIPEDLECTAKPDWRSSAVRLDLVSSSSSITTATPRSAIWYWTLPCTSRPARLAGTTRWHSEERSSWMGSIRDDGS
jgi:hypothetical protein